MSHSETEAREEASADEPLSRVSNKYAHFDPKSGRLTIDISMDHLALPAVALSFADSVCRKSIGDLRPDEDRPAYDDVGEAVRGHVENILRFRYGDKIEDDLSQNEVFDRNLLVLGLRTREKADDAYEYLDDKARELTSEIKDRKSRLFEKDLRDEEVLKEREAIMDLKARRSDIYDILDLIADLRLLGWQQPFVHLLR
jgi:hypothetical protein